MKRRKLLTYLGIGAASAITSKVAQAKVKNNISDIRYYATFSYTTCGHAVDQYLHCDGLWSNMAGFYVPQDYVLTRVIAQCGLVEGWTASIRKNDKAESIAEVSVDSPVVDVSDLNLEFKSGDIIQVYCDGRTTYPKVTLEFATIKGTK